MHFKSVNNCFFPEYTFFDRDVVIEKEAMRTIAAAMWVIVGVASTILNTTLIIFITMHKKYRTSSTNLLILWCFIFNLIITLLNFPAMVWGELNPDKKFTCSLRVAILFVAYLSIHGSVTVLILVSIDRYTQMRNKNVSTNIITKRSRAKARFIYFSIFIWVITLSVTILRILEPETRVLPALIAVAVVAVTVFYASIVNTVRKEVNTNIGSSSSKHVHKVIIWSLVTFVATWLPSLIFGSLRHTLLEQSKELRSVILWFTKTIALNVVIDPLVYLKTYKTIRTIL